MTDPSIVGYFDAWNSGRTQSLAELFVAGGTYRDPTTPGAVSITAIQAGSAEDIEQIRNRTRATAVSMRDFFASVGAGGWTSVWTTPRLNTRWTRCTACSKRVAHRPERRCTCGATLGEPIAWG
ncbi:MAG: hypothetical protein AB7P21_19190 [Lautropia sp.]